MNFFGKRNNDENTEQETSRRRSNPILWIIVGAYLFYLDYNIVVRDGLLDAGFNSNTWYFYVFVVLFAVVATLLIIRSFKELKEEKAQNDRDYDEMIAEEEEEKRLREMYSIEDLEAFEAEQARLSGEESSDDTQE